MATTIEKPTVALGDVVDRLGFVKAQIAELEAEEKELRENLLAAGVDEAEGLLFRATVSRAEFSTTNWKKVAEKLYPSHQLVAAHTMSSERATVRVVSR